MERPSLHLVIFSAFFLMPALRFVYGYLTTENIIEEYIFFEIVSPEELHYTYRTRPARDFGPSFVDVNYKNISMVPVDPPDGCSELKNFLQLAGSVALVDRGGCSFSRKVFQAEAAGALAVIISDNVESDEYFVEMLDDEFEREINIPSTFLLGKNGKRIKDTLEELNMDYAVINIPVNLTFTPLNEWNQPPWIPW